jgi:uncharacterized membrane protein YsdA (DUF1294 family)
MYKGFKHILVGFLVSFIGSIPLGYLNVIGLEFYSNENLGLVIKYLLGVVLIEVVVIYLTFKWASKLVLNTNWKKGISIFSILFLLILAFIFHTSNNNYQTQENPFSNFIHFPFAVGILLSSINFAQIPFWFSWNLYLMNQGYINNEKKLLPFYIVGAAIGTFFGMMTIIISLHKVSTTIKFQDYVTYIFIVLAIFQAYTLYKEQKKSATF